MLPQQFKCHRAELLAGVVFIDACTQSVGCRFGVGIRWIIFHCAKNRFAANPKSLSIGFVPSKLPYVGAISAGNTIQTASLMTCPPKHSILPCSSGTDGSSSLYLRHVALRMQA